MIINNNKKKRTCQKLGFAVQSKNQRKRNGRQTLKPCQRTKKTLEREGDCNSNYNWRIWNDS